MFRSMKDLQKAYAFTGIVIVLAVAFSLIPGINSLIYMMTPTIAALLMMLVVTKDGYSKDGWKRLGLHKLGLRGWLFAFFIPIIPLVAGYLIVWAAGLSSLVILDTFHGFSWGTFPFLIGILFVKAILVESMGEELGWRGYLLPNMLKLGTRKAMLLNGFIHGIWHLPVMLFTSEYHDGENSWLLLPLSIASTVFLAPVIGSLRMRTGSVWTSSVMHTSHNLVWLVLATVFANDSEAAVYIAGDMGIVVVVFYALLTGIMWRKASNGQRQSIAG